MIMRGHYKPLAAQPQAQTADSTAEGLNEASSSGWLLCVWGLCTFAFLVAGFQAAIEKQRGPELPCVCGIIAQTRGP